MSDDMTLAVAVVGAVTGVLGATLGVLNTWRTFDRDRVKLKVSPRCAFFPEPILGAKTLLCINVTNMGFLPVTVSQITFNVTKPHGYFLAFSQLPGMGDRLPMRLESRTSLTVFVPPQIFTDKGFQFVTTACAETQCGKTFKATSGALKSFVKQAKLGQYN